MEVLLVLLGLWSLALIRSVRNQFQLEAQRDADCRLFAGYHASIARRIADERDFPPGSVKYREQWQSEQPKQPV